MTEVLFYHLERARLEAVLPDLLEKTLGKGWRAAVRTISPERVEDIDRHLWTYRDEAFLPHGRAGADPESASRQPVWISADASAPNAPDVLFLVDGAEGRAEELGGLTRCVVIFDGADDAAAGRARAFWKRVREAGHEAAYWRQGDDGRWGKQG